MQQTCKHCSTSFEITDDDLRFYEKVSPTFNGKKFQIPPPTCCPECRVRRRLIHWNRYNLYKRQSDRTGEELISIYSKDNPTKVYESRIWWGDEWDPMDYGQEPNPGETVLTQFARLKMDVPMMNLVNDKNENCPYVNTTGWAKDCHMCFGADYSEMCFYSEATYHSHNCSDCLYAERCVQCYECIDCSECNQVQFAQNCQSCTESFFLYDCIGCTNCFGCVGLRHKEYNLWNEQLTKEEYEATLQKLLPLSRSSIEQHQQKLQSIEVLIPHKAMIGTNNQNAEGDYLYNSKNAYQCFDSDELEDCKYCVNTRGAKDCYDLSFWGHPGELMYECGAVGEGATRMLFCEGTWTNVSNLLYCSMCMSCKDCFACCGLRHKQYCIFNKQYTQEEYEQLVASLIERMIGDGEWGEYFPESTSRFAYNETMAHHVYPLEKEEVLQKGWRWKEAEDDLPAVKKVLPGNQLPETIDAVPDEILEWAVECPTSKRPFNVTRQELDLYRELGVPVPSLHFSERHKNRWSKRNPRKLWERACQNCQKDIQTTYAPERPEIVYCEDCYLNEVY